MAAAAYAKDLLRIIALNKIEAERKLSKVLKDVSQQIKDMHSLANNVNTGVKALQEDSHTIRYSAWKIDRGSFLWLYGIPGCSKTILSSTVIENLKQSEPSSTSLLYHYFDFADGEKQNLGKAVRSLLGQIYNKKPDVREYLDSLYASCDNGNRQPSDDALRKAVQSMIQHTGEVWIVLDALDECQIREEFSDIGLLSWIKDLHKCPGSTHLLVTSHPEQDINQAIKTWASSDYITQL
ncbi:hypothetical protein Daus18300_012168 [Diaporthe australafricana]|uniref:Nephrocystin 3-like N-terminal domain-containing protein n=1 Tax=Diaporthe australafricana TaxID=127596 RepID=A0ABR3W4G0_9PEZI